MKLAIVATLYKSSPYLAEFHRRASAAAAAFAGDDYEIVLVNDGSPDDSLAVAIALADQDAHVVVVDLSRNFGHHKAMMTGLAHSTADLVYLIDSDLEEHPEWLAPFSEQMFQEQADVVYGVQESRKGGLFERWSGSWFWSLFNMMTDMSLTPNIVTARLMTRRYVDALVRHAEREVFMAGLWHITGFVQKQCVVHKLSRGMSTYTLRHKVALLVNSITSFSNKPLTAIFYIGAVISGVALAANIYLVLNWLFFSRTLSGWTSLMASIWLIGGMLISSVGVIGIYLSKIFSEVKQRPYSIVRQIYRGGGK
ncbi:glycosyltransferase family 2 protein [Herbaspirillum sp. RU 5E]|uniref:glycosyltransferase family 2 protein n=1 Tax=Herbaspirillum sp. CAH-3 TaxID=2605746 RepID=UPI0012AC9EF9|nr:glycosyltransferase family 2 protein [Herbaspirillum sp. CAH-3]MBW9336454.1 glycosyltransferase family 2 protein [Herbaspirillum sp. RU 5E]MRT31947.1 glycosyltransferase family 2 protein [Herbaspirillum sp. CAH-3]